MPTLYAPGTVPVAVTARGFVVLAPDTPHALAARIHALVAEGRGLGGVIEALTGAYGASLTAIPSFGVALADGDAVRVAARGDIAFDIEATTAENVSGAGVTTWTERLITGVTKVMFGAPGAAPAELPVADGVVLADVVVWDAAPTRTSPAAAPAEARAPQQTGSDAGSVDVAQPEPAPEPEPAMVREPVMPPWLSPQPEARPDTAAEAAPASVSASAPEPGTGLIDSRAVLSLTETLIPADSTIVGRDDTSADVPVSADAGPDVADEPWAATVVRGGDAAAPAARAVLQAGDHDGATISLAQARALKAGDESASPTTTGASPLAPPRPPAPGRIRLSTGQVVTLDRTIVIGRRPRSTRVSGTDLPHLVPVDSPQQDISRSHVELRAEGESIVATDLRTTNGTTLLRAGADPVRLHPGEGTIVVPGDVLDLGDGVTVAVEAVS